SIHGFRSRLDLYSFPTRRSSDLKPVPPWLCGGMLSLGSVPTFEIGYNHLHDRLGLDLPLTLSYLMQKTRASASPVSYFVAWETLDRKSTRLNSSHLVISYAVFCL